MNNFSHDNNNAAAPGAGLSGEPVGTGMTVSGATNDTVMDNTFANNDAWGTLFVPFPDSDPGPARAVCRHGWADCSRGSASTTPRATRC